MSLLKRRRDYHGIHTYIDPKRLKKQERSERWRKFLNRIYLMIILGALAWLGYFLFYSPLFQIKNIRILGSQVSSQEEMMKEVADFLNSRKYLIFKRNNFFILDKDELEKVLTKKFVLESLEIKKDWFKDLNLEIKEKLSKLNLCFEERCYLIDYEGVVIRVVDRKEIEANSPLVFYKLQEGSEVLTQDVIPEATSTVEAVVENKPKFFLGRTKLDQETVHFILELFKGYLALGRGPELSSLEIYGCDYCRGESGLFIQPRDKIAINTQEGLKIYFDKTQDLAEQLNRLKILLTNKFKEDELEQLEYIDLRFGERVYYK